MKSSIIFLLALIVGHNILNAQIPKEPGNVPSPQAWNFVQYGKTPISYYTGLPNINVSLDQVEQSGFTLPISLNYNVASVKPDIHPGSTGLGWNLSLGGVVNRTVRGLTDEFYFEQNINYAQQGNQTYTYFNGYRNSSNGVLSELSTDAVLATTHPAFCLGTIFVCGAQDINSAHVRAIPQVLPYLWDDVTYMAPSCGEGCIFYWLKNYNSSSTTRSTAWHNSGGGIVDHLPDEFSFSVMGLTGKFYLPRGNSTEVTNVVCNKKIKVFVSAISENISVPSQLAVPVYRGPGGSADNWYFNMSPWYRNQAYPKTISGFRIVDEEGNQYIFGRRDAFDFDYQNSIEYGIDLYDISQDYWKAESWFLHEIILGNGKSIKYQYERGPFQTSMYNSSYDANVSSTVLGSFNRFDRGGRLNYPSYLSTIYSDDFRVQLNYSESSQLKYEATNADLYNFRPSIPADYIYNKIYEYVPTNNGLKWLKLDQIVVKRNDAPSVFYNFNYNNLSTQRLMLQGIVTNDGSSNISNHQFVYNTSMTLPDYLSGQTDHWGYWNGKSPTSNDPSVFYQDKQPDNAYLYAGVLNRIKYPTNGYTDFTYEPNEYGKVVNPNRTLDPSAITNTFGGGLRIKKIADYDGINATPFNEKEFIYKPGYSSLLSSLQIQQLPSSGILNMMPQYSWTGTVPYFNLAGPGGSTTFRVASSQPIYYKSDDYQIGYSEVAEKNKDGSFSIFKFSNHDNGFKDEGYAQALNDVFNSPFTKYTSKSFERGELLERTDYNSSAQPVYKKTTTYKASDPAKPFFYDFEASYFNNQAYNTGGGSHLTLNKTVVFGTKYQLYKYQFVPDMEEEYVYQNGINPVKNTSQYFYDNPLVARPTRIVATNSKGEETTTILKYAHDYPGVFMMQNIANSKPGTVIERLQLKKDPATNILKVVGGELNEYGLSVGSNMPWLNSIYKLEIDKPFDYSNYSPTVPSTRDLNSVSLYTKDYRYNETAKVLKYNAHYNPVEIVTQNGARTIIVRGGKENLHIASINPPIGEVASNLWGYTSFENYTYWNAEGYISSGFDAENNFNYSGTTATDAFSGKQSFNGVVSSKEYVHSADIYVLAKKGGNAPVFQYIQGAVTNSGPAFVKIGEKPGWEIYKTSHSNAGTKIQINSNGNIIDELRVLPLNSKALMSTFTYSAGTVSGMVDNNFNRVLYEYDKLNRLVLVRDQSNNILKKICYNYAGQTVNCDNPCPTNSPANWQNTATPPTCQQNSCGNTGYQLQEQMDMNPCSSTSGTTRTVEVYNPTACTPASGVTITYQNTLNTVYTATYTNLSTNQVYTFTVPAAGTGTLGCIPAGTYSLLIVKSGGGNPPYALFSTGCANISGTSAFFRKAVNVSTGGNCNLVSIAQDL